MLNYINEERRKGGEEPVAKLTVRGGVEGLHSGVCVFLLFNRVGWVEGRWRGCRT